MIYTRRKLSPLKELPNLLPGYRCWKFVPIQSFVSVLRSC